jgi:hypothetical protein
VSKLEKTETSDKYLNPTLLGNFLEKAPFPTQINEFSHAPQSFRSALKMFPLPNILTQIIGGLKNLEI